MLKLPEKFWKLGKNVPKILKKVSNHMNLLTWSCRLKQICGDLFQDVCLFSDVCVLLGSINYRIQARQLIQDLFLDAPFHEVMNKFVIRIQVVTVSGFAYFVRTYSSTRCVCVHSLPAIQTTGAEI